jgi:HD-GYP domain-containing protein (c-di-GMP phosphodiesterase class II)
MKSKYYDKLEKAARQTILIHKADTLIRIILRTIVNSLKVKHAGIFIYDKKREEYVVKLSRGYHGFKIPSGFAKIKTNNALIRYFTDAGLQFSKDLILRDKILRLLRNEAFRKNRRIINFLEEMKLNLSLYQANVCIPGFFRKELVGILFLGEKNNGKKFNEEEIRFLSVLASDVVMALKNAWLIEDLNRQIETNRRLLLQVVLALASSIEAKDKYTKGHTERVANYSLAIACALKKAKKINNWHRFLEDLRIAALLHDIGKIGIPENILNKNISLSPQEIAVIQNHPLIGSNILENVEEFNEAIEGVKYHHEKYDGTGYPSHLKGKQIPLIAAIISLADTFDAMVTDRPYRRAFSAAEAVNEIKMGRGKQFSPAVVDAFLKSQRSQNGFLKTAESNPIESRKEAQK